MKLIRLIARIFISSCLGAILLNAQESNSDKIAILPFHSNGIDTVFIQTAESILRLEIGKLSTADIISEKRTRDVVSNKTCIDNDCALEIGKKLGASQIFGCKLAALGDKIIVQYFLLEISSGKEILIDQITASNVEDLEVVMKRIAMSIVNRKPVAENAIVGRITEEETKESFRRSSNKNFGVSFGFLYPQNGYDGDDRSFAVDFHFDYELEDNAIGMLLGIHSGFAMNIYGSYLFSRSDICPYVGCGFGFHWVSHKDFFLNGVNQKIKADGFELVLNSGIRIFRTYNFQVILNLEYSITLNDYDDRAIVFTIGIL